MPRRTISAAMAMPMATRNAFLFQFDLVRNVTNAGPRQTPSSSRQTRPYHPEQPSSPLTPYVSLKYPELSPVAGRAAAAGPGGRAAATTAPIQTDGSASHKFSTVVYNGVTPAGFLARRRGPPGPIRSPPPGRGRDAEIPGPGGKRIRSRSAIDAGFTDGHILLPGHVIFRPQGFRSKSAYSAIVAGFIHRVTFFWMTRAAGARTSLLAVVPDLPGAGLRAPGSLGGAAGLVQRRSC
eukprot:768384-Hanusia_phi.AAC.7